MASSPFDQLSEHFANKIYNSDKGRIRLALLQQDLAPLGKHPPLKILDAGGGLGHISRWLASKDHHVDLCDASRPMLDQAAQLNREAGLEHAIHLHHASIESFCNETERQYDAVICHAVLEWLADPKAVLQQLLSHLRPGGTLSLMFYNRHSLILRNAFRGNLRKIQRGDWRGDGQGLTPYQPLDPDELYQWLHQFEIEIDGLSGIRCFYDYLPNKARSSYRFEDLLALEQAHYRQQPYIHMARYIHVLGTRLPRPEDASSLS